MARETAVADCPRGAMCATSRGHVCHFAGASEEDEVVTVDDLTFVRRPELALEVVG